MQAAYAECRNMTIGREDTYFIQDPIESKYGIDMMPIKPYNGKTTHPTTAILVRENVTNITFMDEFCVDDISTMKPPHGFAGRGLPKHTMQVYSKPVGDAFTLVYVVNFNIRCNAKTIRDAFEGDFYQLNLPKGCSPRLTTHLLHFIGTRMGGPSLTDITLTEPDKKPTKSRAYWKEGFAFIKKHGPMGTDLNQNVEWTQYQIHDPASPIFNWPAGLVKESLRNLTSGKSTAASHTIYPLTLRDVKTHILQTIAIPYIKLSAEHGLFLLGRSGIGKTPFSRILALALSDFNIQRDQVEDKEPSYRCGNDLDFFRSSPGSRSKKNPKK